MLKNQSRIFAKIDRIACSVLSGDQSGQKRYPTPLTVLISVRSPPSLPAQMMDVHVD